MEIKVGDIYKGRICIFRIDDVDVDDVAYTVVDCCNSPHFTNGFSGITDTNHIIENCKLITYYKTPLYKVLNS
jgi:predicted transcriptional regulator of viral defense system